MTASETTVSLRGVEDLIRPLDRPGDLGWVVQRHGEIYAEEFGWDTSFEALVARIVADYAEKHDPAREAAWIAEVDGERAGCVFCVRSTSEDRDDRTAQLRILLVEPSARGRRLGRRLVQTCLDFARQAGYAKMMLWTNDPLAAARAIYLAEGFTLVESEEHDSFGHRLVGQVYERAL
ncbi:MAG: GNAT family N-acetyltransferase [Hamadaea sp.]|nr:GNAT family N-acetyltransferase [Hamadaea sp.]